MNRRTLLLMFLFWVGALLSGVHAEAKAYDLVKYRGKAAGVTIAFDFGSGYPEASELTIIDEANGKKTAFTMDYMGDQMRFVPKKGGGRIKSVTVNMSGEDAPPAKVTGSCVAGEKTVSFTLVKKK